MKSGYLYVLVHPSDPDLYKIGVTTLEPEKRLAQHNRNYQEYAGQIVKKTGQEWELKTYIAVPDIYWAEGAFWGATQVGVMPYRGGIEVEKMEWREVQKGLDAASNAGVRPPASLPDYVYAYTASMRRRLEGRGITLLGHVRSMVSGKADFRCDNGHKWRTRALHVAEGQGCPECGLGERDPREIMRKLIDATRAAKWRQFKLGMKMKDVRKLLGEPGHVQAYSSGILWNIGGGVVRFDKDSHVKGWQEPTELL